MGCSERRKEIKRRRKRLKTVKALGKKLEKATVSEKTVMATKLRLVTPGAGEIIDRWGLEKR